MNLYELIDEIEKLSEELDRADDEALTLDLNAKIEALGLQAHDKLAGLWRWIKNLEAEAEMLAAEKKRLGARQSTLENRVESLKAYVGGVLGEGNKWKQQDGPAAFSWRKSEAVVIDDLDALPDCYVKFEKSADKAAIKADKDPLLKGEIPGVRLEQRLNLQVR